MEHYIFRLVWTILTITPRFETTLWKLEQPYKRLVVAGCRLQHVVIRTICSMKPHDEDPCDNDYEQNAILTELHLVALPYMYNPSEATL